MTFNFSPIKTETLGEFLKLEREIRGLTQEELAKKIGINKKYIAILENNDYQNFPSDIYVIGFLKRYAKNLGLEEENLITLFNKVKNISSRANIKQNKTIKKIKIPVAIEPRILTSILIILIFIISASYIGYQVISLNKASNIIINNIPEEYITHEESLILSGKVNPPNSELKINGVKIAVSENGDFLQIFNLKFGINNIEITAANKFGRTTIKSIKVIRENK